MAQARKIERQRYRPEVRRSMILDEAASIVATDGVASVTVDAISKNAEISKSLIYNYFDNLTELLKELLQRELKMLRRKQFQAAEAATTFEELVRGVTHQYLTYIDERGLIIERLQTEPSISSMHDPTDFDRASAVEYIANIVESNFSLPSQVARATANRPPPKPPHRGPKRARPARAMLERLPRRPPQPRRSKAKRSVPPPAA